MWTKDSPLYLEFVTLRIADRAGFRAFIRRAETSFPSVNIRTIPYKSVLVANATLLLNGTAVYFLKRQIASKSKTFLNTGGFSERMHKMRRDSRKN